MSKEYEGEDLNVIAARAERDVNSEENKHGVGTDDAAKGNTAGQGGQGGGVGGPGPRKQGASDSTKVYPTTTTPALCSNRRLTPSNRSPA